MKIVQTLSLSLLLSLSVFATDIAAITPEDKVIADLLNKKISFNTSMQNIQALKDKKINFAIIHSDHAYDMQQSTPELRSIMALYPKMLSLITKKESNITSLFDLKDVKIRACFTSEGTQSISDKIFSVCDINHDYKQLPFAEAAKKLKNGELDAIFSLVGHPNPNIEKLNDEFNITFIPLFGKKFDQLKNDYPYFVKGGFPQEIYQGLENDIKSIGIKALLVTREDVNESAVQTVTKVILENIKTIKKTNFIYRGISKKSLLEGLILPQHKGASKAFNAY